MQGLEIPYTLEARPDTGLYNGKFGIWLFIASEMMLFGALFSAYALLRVSAPEWPVAAEILEVPKATLNSFVLIASSITVMLAFRRLQGGETTSFRRWYGVTILLGVLFLVIKAWEYQTKWSHGLHPADSTFLAIYFALTGFHALHVIGGIAAHLYLWGPGYALHTRVPQQYLNRVEVAAIYWHFVDLVWILLFPAVYLL